MLRVLQLHQTANVMLRAVFGSLWRKDQDRLLFPRYEDATR